LSAYGLVHDGQIDETVDYATQVQEIIVGKALIWWKLTTAWTGPRSVTTQAQRECRLSLYRIVFDVAHSERSPAPEAYSKIRT
jgi:hypothetical protein